jgi:starvation-inducible outer membrane lipoprotein
MTKDGCLAFLLVPLAMLLAGCTSQGEDLEAKETKAALEQATRQTSSIDDARCQSSGFQPGSPGYAQCRKDLDSDRKGIGLK